MLHQKDFALTPKNEATTLEGSSTKAEQILGSTIWFATAVLISSMLVYLKSLCLITLVI